MIAHKQQPAPVPVPSQVGGGRPQQAMHPQQQQQQQHLASSVSQQHEQQYYAEQYNSNSSADNNQIYHHHHQQLANVVSPHDHLHHNHHNHHHHHHNQQQQQHAVVAGPVRFAARQANQPTTGQQLDHRLSSYPQQQQYHTAVNDQAQPQVPPHQLPYHHQHQHQAAPPAPPPPSGYEQQPNGQINYAAHTEPLVHQRTLGTTIRHQAPQRVSPYSTNQHQPVRPTGVRVAGHQYKQTREQQIPVQVPISVPVPSPTQAPSQPQLVSPNSTNNYPSTATGAYQINGQPGPAFVDVEQYPSNSPTLLQQQLNRQTGPGQRLGNVSQTQLPSTHLSQHHQQQPRGGYGLPVAANKTRIGARYEGDIMEPHEQPGHRMNSQQQQQQQPVMIGAGTASRTNVAEQTFYSAGRAGPPPVARPITGPQRAQQQMLPNPMMEHNLPQHHHHQHHQPPPPPPPPPHLLGNPTPPLTPTSNPTHLPANHQRAGNVTHQAADGHQWPQHHGPLNDHVQQQQPLVGYNCNPIINEQLSHHHHQLPAHLNEGTSSGHQRIMPKNVNNFSHQYHGNSNNNNNNNSNNNHHHAPTSQVPMGPSPLNHSHQNSHHQAGQIDMGPTPAIRNQVSTVDLPPNQARLTLPLRDAPLLGPFRLDHDAQFTSKVFHIKTQLFDTLSKSMGLMNPQTATVVQELQFRAYLVKPTTSGAQGDSLLASNNQPSLQARPCSWPELFQLSVNQNVVHLDRSKANHKAIDIFQFCQLGDNMLEIQVNDCYCTHEFVMEAVDRPTLKAFMNSCFKSRLLPTDGCIQKMKFNFGVPGFLIQNQHLQQSAGIFNEYVTEFIQGIEQTRTRISLRCPITTRRMRTPTRGFNCKHLQCFDLESFLFTNRERSQWNCPICSLSIPFNMLELDQHQINIIQAMSEIIDTDDILVDGGGQWQAYYSNQQQQQPQHTIGQSIPQPQPQPQPPLSLTQQPIMQTTAKSTGTFHPQPAPILNETSPIVAAPHHQQPPMRPMSGPTITTTTNRQSQMTGIGSPASWENHTTYHDGSTNPSLVSSPIRRPASAINQSAGRRSANGSPLAKKPYAGQYAQAQGVSGINQTPAPLVQSSSGPAFFNNTDHTSPFSYNTDDLSPLAAMERTIIQHEQQMGPPPFDPNSLTSSPAVPLRSSTGGAGAMTLISPNPSSGSSNVPPAMIQTSPLNEPRVNSAAFSPLPHGVSSPMSRIVPASPQQQQQRGIPTELPQSPMQQQQQQQPSQPNTSISTPATPSSSLLAHGGPETPATPSNSNTQQNCGVNSVSAVSQSPHINSTSSSSSMNGGQQSGVDHQPLSNGSASAGSITSTSTMTPSGQSLGSVGMGGDSRCGTAPLQGNGPLGLDDLMLPNASSHACPGSSQSFKQSIHGNSPHIDEKNEILMGKLMMDSNESILRDHRVNGELAIALEEAEWKQQLDRGKSEHLANFLNEPLMKKQHQQHYQQQGNSNMLSGGLNPSDDEGNQSHGSSPGHNIDQLEFSNYLDADAVDNGAGLPPDDSILDLFER